MQNTIVVRGGGCNLKGGEGEVMNNEYSPYILLIPYVQKFYFIWFHMAPWFPVGSIFVLYLYS